MVRLIGVKLLPPIIFLIEDYFKMKILMSIACHFSFKLRINCPLGRPHGLLSKYTLDMTLILSI